MSVYLSCSQCAYWYIAVTVYLSQSGTLLSTVVIVLYAAAATAKGDRYRVPEFLTQVQPLI